MDRLALWWDMQCGSNAGSHRGRYCRTEAATEEPPERLLMSPVDMQRSAGFRRGIRSVASCRAEEDRMARSDSRYSGALTYGLNANKNTVKKLNPAWPIIVVVVLV